VNKQEASVLISEKVAAAEALISECEVLAREYGVGFSMSVAYGMGGTFYPTDSVWQQAGWNSSSMGC
jgi:hypothetical protein